MALPFRNADLASSGSVNIEAWAEAAVESISTVNVSVATASGDVIRGTSVALEIPLDAEVNIAPATTAVSNKRGKNEDESGRKRLSYSHQQQQLLRRDSLKRRETLLKGNEGSRRRQKWENDHLVGNPWAELPEQRDFAPQPTHPVHQVPYFLAPKWDERQLRDKVEQAARARELALREKQDSAGNIPRDLRQKLKHSRAAKGLLQDLEERVRDFVLLWEQKERQLKAEGLADSEGSTYSSEEDDEIVFVGRNGQAKETVPKRAPNRLFARDKLIFDSLVDDHGAGFGRWLVHSIAAYYNLHTWSITRGNPARREAYVGLKDGAHGPGCGPELSNGLPRPLWAMV